MARLADSIVIGNYALARPIVDLTDELQTAGVSVTDVIKRIKYVAAVPISFHYRNGYRSAQLRLKDAAERAISVAIARYFTAGGG